MKKIATTVAALTFVGLTLAACSNDADVVSENLSKDADNFKIERRIVFFNGITDKYLLEIQGMCSLGNNDSASQKSVTCKTGKDTYVKHMLGLSDNVSWFMEQTADAYADPYHYKVTFKPEQIIPDIDLRTSGDTE